MNYEWTCTDSDSAQYMRKTDGQWEMIQAVWLDTTDEDIKKGLHQYTIVHGWISEDDITDEDIEIVCASYSFIEEPDRDTIAECILETDLMSDEYTIADADTFEEAEKFIKNFITN